MFAPALVGVCRRVARRAFMPSLPTFLVTRSCFIFHARVVLKWDTTHESLDALLTTNFDAPIGLRSFLATVLRISFLFRRPSLCLMYDVHGARQERDTPDFNARRNIHL